MYTIRFILELGVVTNSTVHAAYRYLGPRVFGTKAPVSSRALIITEPRAFGTK
jgi:hypothetical protein